MTIDETHYTNGAKARTALNAIKNIIGACDGIEGNVFPAIKFLDNSINKYYLSSMSKKILIFWRNHN